MRFRKPCFCNLQTSARQEQHMMHATTRHPCTVPRHMLQELHRQKTFHCPDVESAAGCELPYCRAFTCHYGESVAPQDKTRQEDYTTSLVILKAELTRQLFGMAVMCTVFVCQRQPFYASLCRLLVARTVTVLGHGHSFSMIWAQILSSVLRRAHGSDYQHAAMTRAHYVGIKLRAVTPQAPQSRLCLAAAKRCQRPQS